MIDLHCHSNFSDGELTPNELLKKANELQLSYFSITDHDNCLAYENLDKSIFNGTLIPGVEIVTSFENHVIEILGYGIDTKKINNWHLKHKFSDEEHSKFVYNALTNIFKKNNIRYTKIEYINETLQGKPKQYFYHDLLKYEENKQIIGMEALNSYADFNKKGLNNPNSILFINECSRFPSIREAVGLIHQSGGLCFLAHVYQYNVENHINFINKILNTAPLDGIEVYHSSFSEEQVHMLNEYANKNNLYKCGGSDYHGKLKPGINLGLDKQISEKLIMPWVNKLLLKNKGDFEIEL